MIELLYSEPSFDLSTINIAESVHSYNSAIQELYLDNPILEEYIESDLSLEEFDKNNQNNWKMPESYKNMDIAKYILDKCKTQEELQRVGYELMLFLQLDMFDLLKFLVYLIDVMNEHNIVCGVGRGSSVASYCLYLIGIHKVDSIRYDLNFHDFVKLKIQD